jgi:uncharacterized NAD-dependent epimerase/dehydratase family protein
MELDRVPTAMIDALVVLVLVADSTTVRGAVISVEASSAMALPAPVRASIAIAAAPIIVLVIGRTSQAVIDISPGNYPS